MTNRILDISDRPARLSVQNSLLRIQFLESARPKGAQDAVQLSGEAETYRCERLENPNERTMPLSDVAVLIVSHPQVSLSHAVLAGLATSGAVFVACNEKHMPVSMLLPLVTHSLQSERFAAQAAVALPVKKRAWQQIVRAKIRAQSSLLQARTGADHGLDSISARVRSGDPQNAEAQAARIYWQKLLGPDFRRDAEAEGANACLNYGYAVLRAAVSRAICGAGLHPSLGVHHHNRYDTFCLADDLMEPFRPLVDSQVARLADERGPDVAVDKESKRILLEGLLRRFSADEESRTLFDWASQSAASLAAVIAGETQDLYLPALSPEEEPEESRD